MSGLELIVRVSGRKCNTPKEQAQENLRLARSIAGDIRELYPKCIGIKYINSLAVHVTSVIFVGNENVESIMLEYTGDDGAILLRRSYSKEDFKNTEFS